MADTSLRRAGMSLPAVQRDGGTRLKRRNVAEWIGELGAGWLPETRDSAIPDLLAPVVDQVKLEGMIAIDGN